MERRTDVLAIYPIRDCDLRRLHMTGSVAVPGNDDPETFHVVDPSGKEFRLKIFPGEVLYIPPNHRVG